MIGGGGIVALDHRRELAEAVERHEVARSPWPGRAHVNVRERVAKEPVAIAEVVFGAGSGWVCVMDRASPLLAESVNWT